MIYCNQAATTFPKPEPVKEAVRSWFERIPAEQGRSNDHHADEINQARKRLARFFSVSDPRNLVFSSGATESLNGLVAGLNLSGGHVITTAIEHNSLLRPLFREKKRGRLLFDVVPCDGVGRVDAGAVEKAITPQTKAVFVSHVSNVTGAVQDIESICNLCRKHGLISVIDASQSAGYLPIDIDGLNPGALVCAGHKGLFGLPGVGLTYLSPELAYEPLLTGGTGIHSDLTDQPVARPIHYESGTPNTPGVLSLSAGVAYVASWGCDRIRTHVSDLCTRLIDQLRNHPNIRLMTPADAASRAGVVSLVVNSLAPGEVGYHLQSAFGIVVRAGLHCAPLIHPCLGAGQGTVRISFSIMNTGEEADTVARAVLNLARMG